MSMAFTYKASSAQIVFGAGAAANLGDWLDKFGRKRALLLSTPGRRPDLEALRGRLGSVAAGVFAEAAMHTPVEVSDRAAVAAETSAADCLVALGGGSAIGLGKALAYRTSLPLVAIPTTYSGSEVTPVLGQTEGGKKTTLRDQRVLPVLVLYDPGLTLELPVATSVVSGLNAMAHAAEALYAPDRNPVSTLLAVEGFRALHEALPVLVEEPQDRDARTRALYGAWLCGTVLGSVAMGLHHKLCHTLGGSFGMPHAETHAVLLPHTIAFNAPAAGPLLAPLANILGGSPGAQLFDFAMRLGAPMCLRDLDFPAGELGRAADLASEVPYPNPRPLEPEALRLLLEAAWHGRRPGRG